MKKVLMIVIMALLLVGCAKANTNEYYNQALKSMESEDYTSAIATLQKSIDEEVRLPEAYRAQGISYMKLGDNASAIAALSRSLNHLDTADTEFRKDVMYYLGEARTNHGQTKEAIEVYTEILKLGEDAQSLFLRGQLQLGEGNVAEAQADFDRASESLHDYELYIGIFNIYDSHKMTVEGQEYLSKALAVKPESPADHYERGRIYYYMKDYSNARAELVEAVNGGETKAVLLLGKVYLAMEDSSSARAMYQEYLDTKENVAKAYNGLALCDIYEKNYNSALDNITKGLAEQNEEEQQELLFNEIVVYEYKLDFETAKAKMAEYLSLYPDDEIAIRENEFLQSR